MRINNVIRHKGIKNTSFLVCLSFAWLCLAHSQSFIFPSFAKAQSDAGIIRNICKECDKTMYSLFAYYLPKRHEAIKIENGGFVFDCRAMPNPYWNESLRGYSGRDKPIADFFARIPARSVYFAERMSERLAGTDGVEIEVSYAARQNWKKVCSNESDFINQRGEMK